jgi:hypothetical protein
LRQVVELALTTPQGSLNETTLAAKRVNPETTVAGGGPSIPFMKMGLPQDAAAELAATQIRSCGPGGS